LSSLAITPVETRGLANISSIRAGRFDEARRPASRRSYICRASSTRSCSLKPSSIPAISPSRLARRCAFVVSPSRRSNQAASKRPSHGARCNTASSPQASSARSACITGGRSWGSLRLRQVLRLFRFGEDVFGSRQHRVDGVKIDTGQVEPVL